MVRPLNAIGVPRGPKTRAGGDHERGDVPTSRKLGSGDLPENFFEFKMSVEAILMHFETMFACEIRHIVQTFHVAVFSNIMCFERHH